MSKIKWCVSLVIAFFVFFSAAGLYSAYAEEDYSTIQALNIAATGAHSFTLYVDAPGYYHITLTYSTVPGRRDILSKVVVNGETISETVAFRRFFVDATDAWRTQQGNQQIPTQVEVHRYIEFTLAERTATPLDIWLEAGANELTLVLTEGEIIFSGEPVVTPAQGLMSYAAYTQLHAGAARAPGEMIIIQAQEALYRTSPSLLPVNDRTDPLVTPYHPSYVVLNTIGGNAWRVPGQLIEWEVDVPVSGMYRIALRYAQREKRGFSSRALLINGEIPFAEAADIRFDYAAGFRSRFLHDMDTGEEFWFYLSAGRNIIGLEATLGVFADIIEDAAYTMLALQRFYQDVIMITSPNPDRHRDYQILQSIPDFRERLRGYSAQVDDLITRVDAAGHTFAETVSILNRLNMNINRLANRPDRVAHYINELQGSITALGLFVTMEQEQPLLLDVIGVGGEAAEVFRPRANIFQRIWHHFRAFLGSFTNDFNFSMDVPYDADQVNIEVWVSTGFDVFNIMGRLINEMFVPNHPHISVDLRLVDSGIIFPASLTGQGPDVVLQAQAAMPINFAFRAGAIDLHQFPDFDEVAARFAPAALETLSFQGATYALPDTMTFNMMFYRTDVFEDIGVTEVPNNMQDFLSIVPPLQSRHMDIFFNTAPQPQPGSGGGMVGATTRNLNPVHISFLHQMGGQPFANEGEFTLLADDIGIAAFRYWTDLYTKHGFIVETDMFTRFRMGELPVAVAGLEIVNWLNAGAPEIRGRWDIAPIPGMYNEHGEFRRDNVISVSSNFIVGNIAQRRDTVDEAWEFLKWFTSESVQDRFAMDVESVFGHNWRHLTANLASFENLGWGHMWPALEESLRWSIPIPQVPGGYIAGREVHNAFVNVVVDNGNPVNAILIARDRIDNELTAKRREFGLE